MSNKSTLPRRGTLNAGFVVSYCWEGKWIAARRARNIDGSFNRRNVFFTESSIGTCVIESYKEALEFSRLLSLKAAEIFSFAEPMTVQIEFYSKVGKKWIKTVPENHGAGLEVRNSEEKLQ